MKKKRWYFPFSAAYPVATRIQYTPEICARVCFIDMLSSTPKHIISSPIKLAVGSKEIHVAVPLNTAKVLATYTASGICMYTLNIPLTQEKDFIQSLIDIITSDAHAIANIPMSVLLLRQELIQ